MRALKIAVWGMGVLIIAASVLLVVMIVQRAGKAIPTAAPAGAPAQLSLGQPAGSRIAGIAAGYEGRVAVWVQRPDGERLLVLDTRNGAVLGEIRTTD